MDKEYEKLEEASESLDNDGLDIQDVEEQEQPLKRDEQEPVIDGGKVEDWEPIKMRAYMTRTVLSVWAIWVFVGLIYFVATSVPWLLLSSPTILTYPIYKVFSFYFRQENKSREPKSKKKK